MTLKTVGGKVLDLEEKVNKMETIVNAIEKEKRVTAGEKLLFNLAGGSTANRKELIGAKAYFVEVASSGNGTSAVIVPNRYCFISTEHGPSGIYVVIHTNSGDIETSTYKYDGNSIVKSVTPLFW